jgi:protein TonB
VWLAASIVVHALVLLVFPDELARHAPRVEILHVQIDHQEVPPAREKPPRVRELAERERIAPNPPPGREPAPLSAPAPKAQPRADETRVPRSPPQPQRVEPPAQPAAQPIDEPIPTLVGPAIAEPQVRNAPEMNAPSAPAPAQPSATAPQGGADAAPAPRIADARPLSAPVRYRRTAEQGRVTLKVLVSREGRVAKATLEKTSGYPNLDRHALEAVTRWRFEPARKGDETVEQWLVVNVDY